MSNITLEGKIVFDPKDKTNKHKFQNSWKRMAMVLFSGEDSQYYSWFINKRFNLILNPPLRGAHISFINDSLMDINGGEGTEKERADMWEALKKRYDKKSISITLSTDVRTDGTHWWLVIPEEERVELHDIRSQIGLGRPFYGIHMSLGHANEKNIDHSNYIHRLIQKNLSN